MSTLKLLSNNPEELKGVEKEANEIIQQAKKELFETLNVDKEDCVDISTETKRIQNFEKYKSKKEIEVNGSVISRDQFNRNPKYGGRLNVLYSTEPPREEKRNIYMEIAERMILDSGKVIRYTNEQRI